MDDLDECACGHVRDEHYGGDPEMGYGCAVEGCDCFHFDGGDG